MKQPPYADILRAIADGKQIQRLNSLTEEWNDIDGRELLSHIVAEVFYPEQYRIKLPMIIINGHEVPEPLRELPKDGVTVYWPAFGGCYGSGSIIVGSALITSTIAKELLALGILHLTHEAAAAHARALLSFTIAKE